MDITPTERTIVEYSLTLSAADADLALNDPFTFGEKVRESLLPHLPKSVPVAAKFLPRHMAAKHDTAPAAASASSAE